MVDDSFGSSHFNDEYVSMTMIEADCPIWSEKLFLKAVNPISVNGLSFEIIHRITIDEDGKNRLMHLFKVDSPKSLTGFINLRFNIENGYDEFCLFWSITQ